MIKKTGVNIIEIKLKQITKLNSQSFQCYMMKLREKKSIRGKKTRVNQINSSNLQFGS